MGAIQNRNQAAGASPRPTVHPIFSYDNYIAKFQFDNKLS